MADALNARGVLTVRGGVLASSDGAGRHPPFAGKRRGAALSSIMRAISASDADAPSDQGNRDSAARFI